MKEGIANKGRGVLAKYMDVFQRKELMKIKLTIKQSTKRTRVMRSVTRLQRQIPEMGGG